MSEPIRLTAYNDCEAALKNNDLRQSLYDAGSILMEKVLVNLHGEGHRSRRSVEGLLFRRSFFRLYEAEILPPLIDATLARLIDSDPNDLKDISYRIMLHVSLSFSGIDRLLGTDEESEELNQLLIRLGQAATLGQHTGDEHDRLVANIESAINEFEISYFGPSRERRELLVARVKAGEMTEQELPRDVLTLLLLHQDKLNLSHSVLLKEIAFYYLASAHTSVHSLTHCMHEIFSWLNVTGMPVTELLKDQLLLQRCVHESVRLHPSSPEAWRVANVATTLPDGCNIKAGTAVVIDLLTANRQTDVFGEDANKFNPNRARPSALNPAGLSFGSGMHACIGLNLAAGTFLRDHQTFDSATHQFGTLSLIVKMMLEYGIRMDSDHPPEKDMTTARETWLNFPVRLAS